MRMARSRKQSVYYIFDDDFKVPIHCSECKSILIEKIPSEGTSSGYTCNCGHFAVLYH